MYIRLAITVLCLSASALLIGACASGSSIVTGNTRAPVAPELVKLYLEPPVEFETIGIVNASSASGWTEQGSMDYAIQELKKQAAKLGANGVLLVSSGEKTTTIFNSDAKGNVFASPITAKTIQAKAIFVRRQ